MNNIPIDILSHFAKHNYFDAEPLVIKYFEEKRQLIFSFIDTGEMLARIFEKELNIPYQYRIVTIVFNHVNDVSHEDFTIDKGGLEIVDFVFIEPNRGNFMMNHLKISKSNDRFFCEMDFERGLGAFSFTFGDLKYYQIEIYETANRGNDFLGAIDKEKKNWIVVDDYLRAIADDYEAVILEYS